jgi:hypothetical protein
VAIGAAYVALVALITGQVPGPESATTIVAPATTSNSTPTTSQITPPRTPAPLTPVSSATPDAPTIRRLLAGTVVEVQLVEKISSSNERIGNRFDLKLAAPIVVDGTVIAPAGATGQGEVIDAAAAGIGGHPGKLILAARYVEANGLRIPLRGFRLAGEGKDNTGVVIAADIAVGVISFLIPGGNISFPAGTTALAKVAANVTLPPNVNSEPNR